LSRVVGVSIAPDPTQLDEADWLSVVSDPVFYPDVIISLLITRFNEVNNVIGCRSLSR